MALPRVLSIGSDNQLRMDVPPEFASLRNNTQTLQRAARLGDHQESRRRDRLQLQNRRRARAAWNCGRHARSYLPFATADGSKPSATVGGKTVALSPDRDGVSTVHLWIDGSIIETLVDSKEAMTARCYTPSPDGIRIKWYRRTGCYPEPHGIGRHADLRRPSHWLDRAVDRVSFHSCSVLYWL